MSTTDKRVRDWRAEAEDNSQPHRKSAIVPKNNRIVALADALLEARHTNRWWVQVAETVRLDRERWTVDKRALEAERDKLQRRVEGLEKSMAAMCGVPREMT